MGILRLLLLIIFLLRITSSAGSGIVANRWQPTNVQTGSVLAFQVTDEGAVLAATSQGIFRSEAPFDLWDLKLNMPVRCLAQHPDGGFIAAYNGVYRSTDDGLTWTRLDLNSKTDRLTNIRAIAVTSNSVIIAATDHGLVRSSDNGLTWMPVGNDLPVRDIRSMSTDGENVFVGTFVDTSEAHFGYIFRSDDDGESWERIFQTAGMAVSSLTLDPHSNVLAATSAGMFFLEDAEEADWTKIEVGTLQLPIQFAMTDDEGTRFIAAKDGIWYANGEKKNWQRMDDSTIHRNITTLGITHDGILLCGTKHRGIWKRVSPAKLPELPILIEPSDGARNILSGTKLRWHNSSGSEKYEVELATDSEFTQIVARRNHSNATALSVPDFLSHLTKYFWRVAAINAFGSSGYSETWSFTTAAAPPDAPSLVFPDNLSTNVSTHLKLFWNEVQEATSYRIQLADDSLWTSVLLDETTSHESLEVNRALKNRTRYCWRVRSVNSIGTSSWSETRSFTTMDLSQAPLSSLSLIAPAPAATIIDPQGVTFRWRRSARKDILEYRLEIDTSSSMASPIITEVSYSETVKVVTLPANRSRYWWRVRTRNSADLGASSEVRTLMLASPSVARRESEDGPTTYSLDQNHPNPFNPSTEIRFSVPEASHVSLKIYTLLGIEVSTLINENLPAGVYTIPWTAEGIPSGVYLYRLQTGSTIFTRKMVLTR